MMRHGPVRSRAVRKTKGLISLFAVFFLTIVINTAMQENEKKIPAPDFLFGIPTYPGARISQSLSSFSGNPYTAVFLSNDPYEKILQFYKEKLKIDYQTVSLGLRKHNMKTFYMFKLQEGILDNNKSVGKGVEVYPLNSRSQRVFKAITKIKIILPRTEVDQASRESKTNPK